MEHNVKEAIIELGDKEALKAKLKSRLEIIEKDRKNLDASIREKEKMINFGKN